MTPSCPVHKKKMVKRTSAYNSPPYYRCVEFPHCSVNWNEDGNGNLMPGPSDKDLRKRRWEAHDVCEKIFGTDKVGKKTMYKFLSEHTGKTFSGMNKQELENLMHNLMTYCEPRLEIAIETKTLLKKLLTP